LAGETLHCCRIERAAYLFIWPSVRFISISNQFLLALTKPASSSIQAENNTHLVTKERIYIKGPEADKQRSRKKGEASTGRKHKNRILMTILIE